MDAWISVMRMAYRRGSRQNLIMRLLMYCWAQFIILEGGTPGMPALLRRMMAFEPFGALVANWWMPPPPLGRPHPRMFVGTTISALCPKFNDRVVPTCLTGPSNWFSPPASACAEFAGILCKGR